MSIEEPQKIDIVATRPGSKEVRLVITDHLPWSSEGTHLLLLQEKLNTYIAFVESGQLLKLTSPKVPLDPEIIVVIVAKHPPTSAAETFLERVKEVLSGIGIGLLCELRADEPAE
jgi:hypothetical protein